jgi:hypothetical protein
MIAKIRELEARLEKLEHTVVNDRYDNSTKSYREGFVRTGVPARTHTRDLTSEITSPPAARRPTSIESRADTGEAE